MANVCVFSENFIALLDMRWHAVSECWNCLPATHFICIQYLSLICQYGAGNRQMCAACSTYDIMWREAMMQLLDQLEAENPEDPSLAPKVNIHTAAG